MPSCRVGKSWETVKSACTTAGRAVFAEHFSVATIRSPGRTSHIVVTGSEPNSGWRSAHARNIVSHVGLRSDRRQRLTAADQGIAMAAGQTVDG